MKFLSHLSQSAQRFGNRFSNLQLRVVAVLALVTHFFMVWAIPSYESPLLMVWGNTLFIITFWRRHPVPSNAEPKFRE